MLDGLLMGHWSKIALVARESGTNVDCYGLSDERAHT